MRLGIISILIIILFTPLFAQGQVTSGNLEGYVQDSDGQPVSGARVTVRSSSLQGQRESVTGMTGFFEFPVLPVGRYTVTVAGEGFHKLLIEDVAIRLGRITNVGALQLVGIKQDVEVMVIYGDRELLDPISTFTGSNLTSDEFKNLPLERDYSQMAYLLPHTTDFGGLNVGGATHLENRYFIDGIDATEPFWGDGGLALPYEFIQEVQVRTGAYQAEYRSSLGGVMNVITRSGSNEFQGQVFGFYTGDQLYLEERVSAGEPPGGDFKSYDFGFGLSGALKKDKLWYSLSFNPTFTDRMVEVPTLGFHPDETRGYRTAGKLNWRLNERNDLAFTILSSLVRRKGIGNLVGGAVAYPTDIESIDLFRTDSNTSPLALALDGVHWVGDNFLIETSASYYSHVDDQKPAAGGGGIDDPFVVDYIEGTYSGGYPSKLRNDYTTVDLGAKGTWILDRHTWKAGFAFRDRRGAQTGEFGLLERVNDPDFGEIYSLFEWLLAPADAKAINKVYSGFAQDSWRLNEQLNLNLGLRWDGQRIIGSDGEVGVSILDQWQPRAGFTYQIGDQGSRKVFGNMGRYYQEIGSPVGQYFTEGGYQRATLYDHDPRLDPSGGIVVLDERSEMPDPVENIDGQYYDEISLGYEQTLGNFGKVTVRGIYRELGNGVENAFVDGEEILGNPGYGDLEDYPKLARIYKALELTYEIKPSQGSGLVASYVLSRTEGNYSGLFSTTYGSPYPNLTEDFDYLETTVNGYGLMTNDRPHVLKLHGWYETRFGLTLGAAGSWMSGTPLSELANLPYLPGQNYFFLSPRGSAGRTPSIWDLNLRVVYDLPFELKESHPQLIVDLMHVGNPRKAVGYDQIHFYNRDEEGNLSLPNPTYGVATLFQPPMMVRVGVRAGF